MAHAIMKWTVLGRSAIPDISCLPTRIQDIPKEILRMYGIVLDSEEPVVSSDDEDVLVIDENPPPPSPKILLTLDLTKYFGSDQKATVNSTTHVNKTKANKKTNGTKTKITKPNDIDDEVLYFCDLCSKIVSDISLEEHKKKHCFQPGCPEMILDDVDRRRHIKMHDHKKPFLCKWCKKRYRFQSRMEKHLKVCKMVRKAKETWRAPIPIRPSPSLPSLLS